MEKGVGHEVLPIVKDLLASDSCWERKRVYFFFFFKSVAPAKLTASLARPCIHEHIKLHKLDLISAKKKKKKDRKLVGYAGK